MRRAVDGFRRRTAKIARKAEKPKSRKMLFWQFGAKSRKAEKIRKVPKSSEKCRRVPTNLKKSKSGGKNRSRKVENPEKCHKTLKVKKWRKKPKSRIVEKSREKSQNQKGRKGSGHIPYPVFRAGNLTYYICGCRGGWVDTDA